MEKLAFTYITNCYKGLQNVYYLFYHCYLMYLLTGSLLND